MVRLVATQRPRAGAASASAAPPPARKASRPLLALCDAPHETSAVEERSTLQEPAKLEETVAPLQTLQLPEHLEKLRAALAKAPCQRGLLQQLKLLRKKIAVCPSMQ